MSRFPNGAMSTREPVYITKNGQGDLVVMSIEAYEGLVGKFELRKLLGDGMEAVKQGKVRPFRDALHDIDEEFMK